MFVIDTASLYGYNKQTTDLLKLRARSFRWKVKALFTDLLWERNTVLAEKKVEKYKL
jgi:hypothetical protein